MKPASGLPGLPTVAVLMFAAMIAVWLGVAGPMDLQKVKEWQTLLASIVAPSIAFCAAIVAYKAAMAKVKFDREVHDDAVQRQWRGLMLRLQFGLEHFIIEGAALGDVLLMQEEATGQITVTAKILAMMRTPVELDEAWKDLGLFDEALAKEIAGAKTQFQEIEMIVSHWPADQQWVFTSSDDNLPKDLVFLQELNDKLEAQCKVVIALLQSRIATST